VSISVLFYEFLNEFLSFYFFFPLTGRRIISERNAQIEREKKRHDDEVNFRLQRSSEGPAHFIVQKIVEVKSKKENEFYTQVMNSDNLLNKQLKASEDAARTRAASNGKSLEEEWQRNTEFKIRKKIEDDERNNRVRQTRNRQTVLFFLFSFDSKLFCFNNRLFRP
jgi:hypothetical protein